MPKGSGIAVYFGAPDNGWYEGIVLRTAAVGDSIPMAFEDGPLDQWTSAASYGRYNMWVLRDATRPDEAWRASGHELLGQRLVHTGATGRLRMWCDERREFSMAVRVPGESQLEKELILLEEEVGHAVSLGTAIVPTTPSVDLDPEQLVLLSRRAPLLRRKIVGGPRSGTSRRGMHSPEDICCVDEVAELVGLKSDQWHHLLPNAVHFSLRIVLAPQASEEFSRGSHMPPETSRKAPRTSFIFSPMLGKVCAMYYFD